MTRKTHLQRHRLRAFSNTLSQVESALEAKIYFLDQYADHFKMPKMIMHENLRIYNRCLKAAKELKAIDKLNL